MVMMSTIPCRCFFQNATRTTTTRFDRSSFFLTRMVDTYPFALFEEKVTANCDDAIKLRRTRKGTQNFDAIWLGNRR